MRSALIVAERVATKLQQSGHEMATGRGQDGAMPCPVATESPVGPSPAGSPIAGGTILLVEDNAAIAKVLTRVLRPIGCRVVVAADGIRALDAFDRDEPVLVLLDLQLPWADGFAVLRHIRRRSKVPVMVVTAQVDREAEALQGGADAFVTKPFDNAAVLATAWRLLGA
jgi:two-component system response regulator AdeR